MYIEREVRIEYTLLLGEAPIWKMLLPCTYRETCVAKCLTSYNKMEWVNRNGRIKVIFNVADE